MKSYYDIIIEPVISEKSTELSQKQGKYVFKVEKKANKHQIKDAIEHIFNVKVEKVNTMNYRGKKKFVRGRFGKTASWKKAVVTLKEGQKIDFT